MKLPSPRWYQQKSLDLSRKAFSEGKRKILIWLATGGGKSVIFLLLIAGLLKSGKKVIFVVKRKQLVLQTQKHFTRAGIKSSVMMANHKGFNPDESLQICSIDTINNRDLSILKGFYAVVVDEAHDGVSPSYQSFFKVCESILGIQVFFGLTATPFPVGKKVHDFWDACIKPVEMHQLCEEGFLVPCDIYLPDPPDLSDVKISPMTGDYDQKALSLKMRDKTIVGNTVDLYKFYSQDLPNKTAIVFCVDKEHSMTVSAEFNRAGIKSTHCDEATPQDIRDACIKELQDHMRAGKPYALCNVNIFSTGVDIPEIGLGMMSRPTDSECLWIQQVGRVLRPCKICLKCNTQYDNSPECPVCHYTKTSYHKKFAVVVDQGNNAHYLGNPYMVRYPAMTKEDLKNGNKTRIAVAKTCQQCFRHYAANLPKCPRCESVETKERIYQTIDGEFRLYDEYEAIKKSLADLQLATLEQGKKPTWKFFRLYEQYGEVIMKYKEEFKIPSWVPDLHAKSKEKKLQGKLYK